MGAGIAGAAHRWNRPQRLTFGEAIEASTGDCASEEPLGRDDISRGFDLSCTMRDSAPGNRDRPYIQVRLEGCDDWQRLDHDDSPEAVTILIRLAPCRGVPSALEWQVCQTHGGPLPDDCTDGSSGLPPG